MKYLSSLLSLTFLFLLLACGGGDDDTTIEPFMANLSVSLSPSSIEEGQSAELTFTLTEVNSTGSTLIVGYTTGGDASSNDYSTLSGAVSFPSGQSTSNVTISTLDDDTLEPSESLLIAISANALPSGVSMGSPANVTLTITDNDVEPSPDAILVGISLDKIEVEEGGAAELTVSLSEANSTGSPVVIAYSLSGDATSVDDFEALSGSISIADGQSSGTIDIATIDDEDVESGESLVLTLSTAGLPENYELSDTDAVTLMITDNDQTAETVMVTIATDKPAIDENGTAMITVSLSKTNDTGADVTIGYEASGTATDGMDYQMLSGAVTIANGTQSGSFALTSIDDTEEETDETVILTLLEADLPQGYILVSPNMVEVTIMDDDEVLVSCSNDNSMDQDFFACNQSPTVANSYNMTVSGDTRTIVTNGVPEHDFRNQVANLGITDLISDTETYSVDATPSLASSITSILKDDFTPNWKFGVAVNGVPIDPAPGTPFIFTDANTGEFNWDWVFEPTNNMEQVGLDCNISHLQPDQSRGLGRIHYHGDMADFADDLLPGIGSGNTTPSEPLLIGWAADGFPIVYKYGPNALGALTELQPSYQVKAGQRSGDGISEPCGEYNGKYTNDYEYISSIGDLDECNGISQSITVGGENFGYFYVITEAFPVISRCMSGTPSQSFKVGP
ncbi:MAG: YHYH protein [Cyclobacteriaceae bacterium]